MSARHAIRVLHCIDTLGRGGAETLLLDLCSAQSDDCMDLHVLATGGGILESDFRSSAIPFERRDRSGAIDLSLIRYIREYCEVHHIDIVHGHQPVSTLHALLACHGTSTPVIHSIHGFTEDIKNRIVLRSILGHTEANILVSQSMHEMVIRNEWIRDIPNMRVVHNGVNTKRLACDSSTLRTELDIPADATVLGMIGNFYNVKDQLTLCRAMKEVHRSNPNVHCVFAGRADDVAQYAACIDFVRAQGLENHVHFLGGRSDVPNILGALDIFVFSTLKDTFGLALVEAMLSGIPCIASDIAVMREITLEGTLAALFHTADPMSLARTIRSLLDAPCLARRMALSARSYANTHYTIESHRNALFQVYDSILTHESIQDSSTESRYFAHIGDSL